MRKQLGMRNRTAFQNDVVVAAARNACQTPDSDALSACRQNDVVPNRITDQRKTPGKETRYVQPMVAIRGFGIEQTRMPERVKAARRQGVSQESRFNCPIL